MKLKIVHITQALGGVKTYIEHVFKNTCSNELEYVVIAPYDAAFISFCQERSIRYYPITLKRSISPINDLIALLQVTSILKKEKPDIVHTHSAKGGYLGRLAAKATDAKVIYSPHAFSYLSFKGMKRMMFYLLEFIARPWTDILLSVSHSEANRAIFEVGYDEEKVKVILNAIPVDDDLPFRSYDDCKTIGMIGRLTDQKNPFLFLKVASMLATKFPHLQFSILGAGFGDHLSNEIHQYINNSNLKGKIKILGWGDSNTTKSFLAEIDVFVMTSVFEGLPFSLIEAMSTGIPCVVSKVDGNTDVIHNNENGFACLSIKEFCKKIELIVTSEELRRKFGLAGYRYIKEIHEIKTNIKQLESLYLELAARADLKNSSNRIAENVNVEEQIHLQAS